MIEITLNNIQKYFGATEVLHNVTFSVQSEEKVGVVGRNGSGKSTILKIIKGIEAADSGSIFIKKGSSIGYLDQIPSYDSDTTVLDVLQSAFDKTYALQNQIQRLENQLSSFTGRDLELALKKYGDLQQQYEVEGGYEIAEKLSKICTGLKLGEAFQARSFSTLSGGEKTTVILGKILLQAPDILLLDEPSNHLDMESMEWLESFLKEYKGIALVVSHDRYFLDQVVTRIIEIEDMEAEVYEGNYSAYVKEKENRLLLQFEAFEDQQKKIKAMEKAIKDLRDWAQRGDNNKFFRRAESMQKRLDKIQKIEKPILERPSMQILFSNTSRSGKDVIRIQNLSKSFGEKSIFDGANLHLRYGEKTALIGSNGSGKSTLLKILLNEYSYDSGIVELGAGLKIGYLPQIVTFENEDATVLDCFREDILILEGKAREYLSKFLFYGETVFKKVRTLSGGERSRLKLAKLMYQDINFLILDEPTNHLDIDSRETLEEALLEFKDTIFFISHDRYFINKLCNRILELKNKSFIIYEGNYEYYKEKKEELQIALSQEEKELKFSPLKIKEPKIDSADCNKKNEYKGKKLEEAIESLEIKIRNLDLEMETYCSDSEKLTQLFFTKEEAQQELDQLLEQWLTL